MRGARGRARGGRFHVILSDPPKAQLRRRRPKMSALQRPAGRECTRTWPWRPQYLRGNFAVGSDREVMALLGRLASSRLNIAGLSSSECKL